MTFSSNSGTEYSLEESEDLATWRSKSSLTATRTNSTFQVTNSSGVRTRFYRVREQ